MANNVFNAGGDMTPHFSCIFKAAYNMELMFAVVIGWRTHGVDRLPCGRHSNMGGHKSI